MLVPASIWTLWNSLRVLLNVAKFVSSAPEKQSMPHNFYVHTMVNFIVTAMAIVLRLSYLTFVILHYKWMTFPSTTQEDLAPERSRHVDTFEQGNDNRTPLTMNAGIDHQNSNNRQLFSFKLTTLLAVASFISLLMPVLVDLPEDIAFLAEYEPLLKLDFSTYAILITRIAVNCIELVFSVLILICLWANCAATWHAKFIVFVTWGARHVVRVILQFAYCIWRSLNIEDVDKAVPRSVHVSDIISTVGEYFELVIWMTAVLLLLIVAYKEITRERNHLSSPV